MGLIQTGEEGKVDFLVEIEHQKIPIPLKINSPFPCYLQPHEEKVYSMWNPDSDLLDITIDMFSGYVDVFVND